MFGLFYLPQENIDLSIDLCDYRVCKAIGCFSIPPYLIILVAVCHVLHLISEEEIHSHCLRSKHLAHSEPSGDPSLLCDNIPWELIIIT